MNYRKSQILIGILSILMANELFCQTYGIQFKHLSTRDGLAGEYINAIIQDRKGFMWFGPNGGLCRYDGYSFKSFSTNAHDSILSHSSIECFLEDSLEGLWIGNSGLGLTYLNFKTQKYIPVKYVSPSSRKYNLSFITSLLADHNNILYLGTRHEGLFIVETKIDSGQVHIKIIDNFRYNGEDSIGIAGNYINDIVKDKKGNLWIGTNTGLSRLQIYPSGKYSIKNFKHNPADFNSLARDHISDLAVNINNNLVIATSGGGIDLFDINGEDFKHFRTDPGNIFTLSSDIITCIDLDRFDPEIVWAGTRVAGFNRLNLSDGNCTRYQNENVTAVEIGILSIFQDQQGAVWLGTWGNGVSSFNPYLSKFKSYSVEHSRTEGLTNADILNFFEPASSGESIWMSAGGSGLFEYNRRTGKYNCYTFMPHHSEKMLLNMFTFMTGDKISDNNTGKYLWLGTWGYGLRWFDTQDKIFVDLPFPDHPLLKEIKGLVRDIFLDLNHGRKWVWVATEGRGLYIYDFETKSLKNLHRESRNEDSFPADQIMDILRDRNDNFWLATIREGVLVLDPESFKIKKYVKKISMQNSLCDNYVNSIFESSLGEIWICTYSGLNKYRPESDDFQRYFHEFKYPDNLIEGMLEDRDQNLWLSTRSKIINLCPEGKIIKIYDYTDGITTSNFTGDSRYITDSGEMFFGGVGGYISFSPELIRKNLVPPEVAITDFKINNISIIPGHESVLLIDPVYTRKIQLPYTKNSFTFEFAALDYINPQKNRYKYKMEGINNDWITTDASHRYSSYTQLAPGNYAFTVIGSNNDGVWNEEGASIDLIIIPPWYRKNLAYAIYLLFFIVMIAIVWREQVNRLRKKHQIELQLVEREKLKELDETKSRFFANISHEFRTPLTLIEGPIKQLKDGEFQGNVKDVYNLILKNTNRLLGLINQLLDLSKLEAKKLKLKAAKQNILPLLSGLVQSFESLAKRKDIEYVYTKPEVEVELYFDQEKFEKIIINLLANAFKFTPDGGRIEITIQNPKTNKITNGTLQPNTEYFEISFTNSGSYLTPEQVAHIFDRFYQVNESSVDHLEGTGIGLALVKELVELHHGRITVQSDQQKGTTFKLALPFGKNHLKPEEISEHPNNRPEHIQSHVVTPEDSEGYIKPYPVHSLSRQHILIVEDNKDVRAYIASLINNEYAILEAENGKMALAMAKKKNPDLIITDVMMPEMDGMEFCRRLKEDIEVSHIPVIMLTARADLDDKLDGLELGADDYIAKPFEARELRLRIRNVLNQRKRVQDHILNDLSIKPFQSNVASVDQQFMQKLLNLINDELHNPDYTILDIADRMNVSRATLNRKITAFTGSSPIVFLRTLRLKRARQLIQSGAGNISEISLEVGFNSLSHFTQVYRNHYGVKPSDDLHAAASSN